MHYYLVEWFLRWILKQFLFEKAPSKCLGVVHKQRLQDKGYLVLGAVQKWPPTSSMGSACMHKYQTNIKGFNNTSSRTNLLPERNIFPIFFSIKNNTVKLGCKELLYKEQPGNSDLYASSLNK